MIRLAVQAKGRLYDDSTALLKDAGVSFEESKRKLLSKSNDFPVEILYLRDDDIPGAVASGVADIGIVGLNEVYEKKANVDIIHRMGFGKCRLSLAVPKSEDYFDIKWFNDKRVATSYPVILEDYFRQNGIKALIQEISGSVEIAPSVGMADAIFDIVSSGGTLVSNGLKEVEQVINSEAVLICTKGIVADKLKIINQLLVRFEAVERSKGMKYLVINLPSSKIDRAVEILPGMKSPTVMPLANSGWCSVHSVVNQSEIWEKIEKLKMIGAEDILVLSLDKMML